MKSEKIGQLAGVASGLFLSIMGALFMAQSQLPGGGGGGVGGVLTAGQVAYGDPGGDITSEAAFAYNDVTNTLSVGTLTASTEVRTQVYRDGAGNQRFGTVNSAGNIYFGWGGATADQHFFGTVTTVTTGSNLQVANGVTPGSNVLMNITPAGSFMPNGPVISTTASQPTCAAAIRGQMWVTQGGAGAADITEICLKDAGDSYVWTAF